MDNQYGYNNDNQFGTDKQFGMPNQYGEPQPDNINDKSQSKGLAVAAFIIALVNLIFCSCSLSIIAVPLSLIFAIITLVTHRGGKAFAIISIVISVIASVIFAFYVALVVKLTPDLMYFVNHEEQIISEFNETGEVPEYFKKYEEPKFDKYWSAFGYDNFNGFFKDFIEGYRSGQFEVTTEENNGVTVKPSPKNDEEVTTEAATAGSNESGEELVVLSY